jgi:hypothetical protein
VSLALALTVGLVLHELATIKDADEGGARRCTGKSVAAQPYLHRRKAGFGTELIRRAFAFELGGTADLVFEREGVRLDATIPLS